MATPYFSCAARRDSCSSAAAGFQLSGSGCARHQATRLSLVHVLSGSAAVACGLVAVRLSGHVIVMATLASGLILHSIFLSWIDVTRGPKGANSLCTSRAIEP